MADNNLPSVTPEVVKQHLSIALTKATLTVQGFQDEADSLIFNDDPENLEQISAFLQKRENMDKVIDTEHEIQKKPYLEGGRACDTAKKDMKLMISTVADPVQQKYTELCNEIDRKKREKEAKEAADSAIKTGIENNVLDFSQKIASCQSKEELTSVERLINLEKSPTRASKYGEFHQEAIKRYDEVLIPILKDQKTKIDEKEKLEAALQKETDPEKHDELKTQLEEKENEIIQNQVKVQEGALSQQAAATEEPEVVLPSIKTKRTDIVPEIVDMALVFKKYPELLSIELKIAEAKKMGQTLKDAGAFNGKDELKVNGIKFTIKKQWK